MNPAVSSSSQGPSSGADVPGSYEVRGYAIVSDDGVIADADGTMPAKLKNDADWAYFQAELDLCQLVLLGRRSHEAAPNTRRRPRLVVSGSVTSLEQRADAWWWNPAVISLEEALARLLPKGGRVAVPGGQGVFDLLAERRAFDQFHLARAVGVKIPGGRPVFSALARGDTVESVLNRVGLRQGPSVILDASAPVVLAIWRREQ